MKISFTVLGEPKGKGRPQFARRGKHITTRTPDDTVLYENLIRTEYKRQVGAARFGDNEMLDLRVIAYYAIPKSASRKKQRAMEDGTIRPTKKPDLDNILKVVADSLNGYAYKDDAQIVDTQARKFYSAIPRIQIIITNGGTQ